jgi:SAM-dependent methyltransferase
MDPRETAPLTVSDDNLVAAGYDTVYEAIPRSGTFRKLWAEHASSEDFPSEFEHISFLTFAELRDVGERLGLNEGATLVDLACGAGGPGLWFAKSAGATLIGVDLSNVGLTRARKIATHVGVLQSRFVQGSFAATGLDDGAADAAVSVDAVQYAPDKRAAFVEAMRILRPGARFVFTAFEVLPDRVAGLPILGEDPVPDFRPVLEAAGFEVEYYAEMPGWRDRVTGTYRAVLEAQDALTQELGPAVYLVVTWEMTLTLERDPYCRRVLVVARTPR